MGESRVCWTFVCTLDLYLCLAAACFFIHCDARKAYQDSIRSGNSDIGSPPTAQIKLNPLMQILLDMVRPLDDTSTSSSSNTQPYGVSSPFSLPPYDSLAPIPLPQNTPPFCVYPPSTPQSPLPPSTTIPAPPIGGAGGEYPPPTSSSPSFPYQNPPPTSSSPSFPYQNPPPTPSPPESSPIPNPPSIVVPSPPENVPSPPIPLLSPPYFLPSPHMYLPPIVYPPPAVPPPPYTAPTSAQWCVAKPSVPGPIIQEAMNYACASGAECDQIQQSGSCFQPNTLVAHASYAFNSYWQRTKVAGGTCEFGGTAMLVTVDPSYDGCHFIYF